MEELQVIETTSGRKFKPWATNDDLQAAVQDPASITAITSEIASGKAAIASAINAKGGTASATESFSELAQDIQSIQTQEIIIAGGDMYAKQLYGVANNDITPGYWNLYQVMADLLSDARFSNYGGILLAEFFKGYDSIVLSGAGAGGGYYTSDGAYYTDDVTHTWTDDLDGKGNRWVAYLFATESHGFTITDTNLCPLSIHIGRHVGVIENLVNGCISEIVVTDGNMLDDIKGTFAQNWNTSLILRNLTNHTSNYLIYRPDKTEKIYIDITQQDGGSLIDILPASLLTTVIANVYQCNGNILSNSSSQQGPYNLSQIRLNINRGNVTLIQSPGILKVTNLKTLFIDKAENLTFNFKQYSSAYYPSSLKLFIGYDTNDRQYSVVLRSQQMGYNNSFACVNYITVKSGWCKNLDISWCINLTESNIVTDIFNQLGVNQLFIDDPVDANKLTITLGATNLAKLTAEEMQIAIDKGFTLA